MEFSTRTSIFRTVVNVHEKNIANSAKV
jgi:hypothetical protein